VDYEVITFEPNPCSCGHPVVQRLAAAVRFEVSGESPGVEGQVAVVKIIERFEDSRDQIPDPYQMTFSSEG